MQLGTRLRAPAKAAPAAPGRAARAVRLPVVCQASTTP